MEMLYPFLVVGNTFTPWFWWTVAGFLLAIELMVDANYYLLWCGLAAVAIGVIQWCFPGWEMHQTGFLYGLTSVLALVGWHIFQKSSPAIESDAPFLNKRGMEHVGKVISIDRHIRSEGQICLNDTFWKVAVQQDLHPGDQARIMSLEGKTYHLEKIDK